MSVSTFFDSFIESVKGFWQNLDLKQWSESIGGSSAEAIMAVVYFGLSFASGYLFKKYFKLFFACLLFAAFAIKMLEFLKFLTVDWEAIKISLGMNSTNDFNTLLNAWFAWIRHNLLLFIASVIGFLVGYKLG